jgi:hypothetical protein
LEHGFSVDINVGFVEIIVAEGTQQHANVNNTTYMEDSDGGGRPSSCDELEDEDDLWAPELLHSQSQDFTFHTHHDDLQCNVHEGDIEVEEAARLLMSYDEGEEGISRGNARSEAQDRRQGVRSRTAMGGGRGRRGETSERGRPAPDQGDWGGNLATGP